MLLLYVVEIRYLRASQTGDVRCGMKYRKDKYGKDLSQLGYGCMRFTKKGNSIDYAKAEKEVMLAV